MSESADAPAAETPTARRLGRPKDVVSAETHERLLQVARVAFARHGYDATTNRQIATAAGITPAAIYRYYSSKAHLFLAVFEQVAVVVNASLASSPPQATTANEVTSSAANVLAANRFIWMSSVS